MTNTTTEELVMRTMIAELKIMNLKIDLLEIEIDEFENDMVKLEKKMDEKLAK